MFIKEKLTVDFGDVNKTPPLYLKQQTANQKDHRMVAPMSIKPNQSLTAPKTPLEVDITRSLANPADHLPSQNIRVSGFERFQSNQR